MKQNSRHRIGICLLAAVVLLTNLGTMRLWDDDEAFYAATAAEMYDRGDWVVPYFNGDIFGHKPVWMYWMMLVGFESFGVSEFGARIASAVFGIGCCLLTYDLGNRLFRPGVGFLGAVILVTSLMFNVIARAAIPDVFLTFFVTLSLLIWARSVFPRSPPAVTATDSLTATDTDNNGGLSNGGLSNGGLSNGGLSNGSLSNDVPAHWPSAVAAYLAMGVAVLVKGPIGVFFPMAVIGLFLLLITPRREVPAGAAFWRRCQEFARPLGPRNFFRTIWFMRPVTGLIVVTLVAGPWYYLVGVKTDGEFLRQFFYVHHYQRLVTPFEQHQGPPVYYVVSALIGMFPWSILAIPVVLHAIRQLRMSPAGSPAMLFLVCWAGVFIGLFSLSSTKLPNYVLPAYPALALIAAHFYDAWIRQPSVLRPVWSRIGFGSLTVVGIGLLLALPAIQHGQSDGQPWLASLELSESFLSMTPLIGLAGLPAILGGIIGMAMAERGRSKAAVATIGVTAVSTLLALWGYAAPYVDQFQTTEELALAIREQSAEDRPRVAFYHYFRPSLVYYNRGPIESCGSETVAEFLASPERPFVITTRKAFDRLEADLDFPVRVLKRVAAFPKADELLLLRRTPLTDSERPIGDDPP